MRCSSRSRRDTVAVAICLALLATVGTCLIDSQEIAGTSFSFVGWTSGSTPESYQTCRLTNGAFRIQGASTALSDDITLPAGNLQLSNLRVSNGYIVVDMFFPQKSIFTITGASGTIAAGRPFLDASTAIYSYGLKIVVMDSTLRWAAPLLSQSVVRAPATIQITSSLFVVGNTVTQASSLVEMVGSGGILDRSAVAVDYAKCTGCSQGLVFLTGSTSVLDRSMLRISYSSVGNAAGAPLIGAAQAGGVAASVNIGNSLFLVENVVSPTSSLTNAAISVKANSRATLRVVTLNSIGAIITGSVTAQNVTAASIGQSIPSITVVPSTGCAAACVPTAAVTTTCKCTCGSDMPNLNFCTAMEDPYTNYAYTGCSVGCAACSSDTTCARCEEHYKLQPDQTCALTRIPCTDPNCNSCSAFGQCLGCNDGYGPTTTNVCVRCSVTGCKRCPGDTNICRTCMDDSNPVNGECVRCQVEHCATCRNGDSTVCSSCETGYYVSSGSCLPVQACYVSNCAQCMLTDSTKCLKCMDGYLTTSAYRCVPQKVVNGAAAPHSLWVVVAVLLASVATH